MSASLVRRRGFGLRIRRDYRQRPSIPKGTHECKPTASPHLCLVLWAGSYLIGRCTVELDRGTSVMRTRRAAVWTPVLQIIFAFSGCLAGPAVAADLRGAGDYLSRNGAHTTRRTHDSGFPGATEHFIRSDFPLRPRPRSAYLESSYVHHGLRPRGIPRSRPLALCKTARIAAGQPTGALVRNAGSGRTGDRAAPYRTRSGDFPDLACSRPRVRDIRSPPRTQCLARSRG